MFECEFVDTWTAFCSHVPMGTVVMLVCFEVPDRRRDAADREVCSQARFRGAASQVGFAGVGPPSS